MNEIRIKSLTIGEGLPKICVPVMAEDMQDLGGKVRVASDSGCDLIEWRIDAISEIKSCIKKRDDVRRVCEIVNVGLNVIKEETELPILLTMRTAFEGGEIEIEKEEYLQVINKIIEQCCPELIDIEAFNGDATTMLYGQDNMESENADIKKDKTTGKANKKARYIGLVMELARKAKDKGIVTVMSNHDFTKTPPAEEIVGRIIAMDQMGADIPKVAFMPNDKEDVYTLIGAAKTAGEYMDRSFIALSMGDVGRPTRICNGNKGTAITFAIPDAQVLQGSAPGQMTVSEVRKYTSEFYSAADR